MFSVGISELMQFTYLYLAHRNHGFPVYSFNIGKFLGPANPLLYSHVRCRISAHAKRLQVRVTGILFSRCTFKAELNESTNVWMVL